MGEHNIIIGECDRLHTMHFAPSLHIIIIWTEQKYIELHKVDCEHNKKW